MKKNPDFVVYTYFEVLICLKLYYVVCIAVLCILFMLHCSCCAKEKERFMDRHIKLFFQSSGLISSLIFSIVCETSMILIDAFTTKSLHICLPVSFQISRPCAQR